MLEIGEHIVEASGGLECVLEIGEHIVEASGR